MPVTVDAESVAEHDRPVSGPTDREKVKGRRHRRRERRCLRDESHKDPADEIPASHGQVFSEERHRNQQDEHARHADYLMCRRAHRTAPFTARSSRASIHDRSYLRSRRRRLRSGSHLG